VSLTIRQQTDKLCKDIQNGELKVVVAEEEIIHKIESGIKERHTDSVYENKLLLNITKVPNG